MADTVDKVIGIGCATSGLLSYVFYRLYKGRTETALQVESIPVWQPDLNLYDHLHMVDGHCVAFAAVEGVIKELGRSIPSQHGGGETGVVKRSQLVEHRSKRVNGFWSDTKKDLRDSLQSVPFAITKVDGGDPNFNVEVLDSECAHHLQDELDITYDRFDARKSNLMEIGLDRLFGEMTKGIQETEKMLITGSTVLGVGKVFLDNGRLKLGPPDDPDHRYILTRMSLSQLVKSYRSQSSTFKVLSILLATLGGTLLSYLVWKHNRAWIEKRRQRLEFEEIRRAMIANRGRHHSEGKEMTDEDSCVVCLGEPRQVVTLNCGHVALCANCAEALPTPKRCPVCRADIERFVPVFHP